MTLGVISTNLNIISMHRMCEKSRIANKSLSSSVKPIQSRHKSVRKPQVAAVYNGINRGF